MRTDEQMPAGYTEDRLAAEILQTLFGWWWGCDNPGGRIVLYPGETCAPGTGLYFLDQPQVLPGDQWDHRCPDQWNRWMCDFDDWRPTRHPGMALAVVRKMRERGFSDHHRYDAAEAVTVWRFGKQVRRAGVGLRAGLGIGRASTDEMAICLAAWRALQDERACAPVVETQGADQ